MTGSAKVKESSQRSSLLEREKHMAYKINIEIEQEEDGRWIAEVTDFPGVLAYGASKEQALCAVEVLALRVLADRIEDQRTPHESMTLSFACA